MSRASLLMLVGVLTMLASFAALPLSWLHVLLPLFGAITAVIGFMLRSEQIAVLRQGEPKAAPSPDELSPIA